MAFENKRKEEIEVAGMKGTVTVPIIMTNEQLGQYMKSTRHYLAIVNDDTIDDVDKPTRADWVYDNIKHLVIDIDFPGVTLDMFQKGNPKPFPAVVFAVEKVLRETIDNALNVKN